MYTPITGFNDKKGRPIQDGQLLMIEQPHKIIVGRVCQLSNIMNTWGIKIEAEAQRNAGYEDCFYPPSVDYTIPFDQVRRKLFGFIKLHSLNALIVVRRY